MLVRSFPGGTHQGRDPLEAASGRSPALRILHLPQGSQSRNPPAKEAENLVLPTQTPIAGRIELESQVLQHVHEAPFGFFVSDIKYRCSHLILNWKGGFVVYIHGWLSGQ